MKQANKSNKHNILIGKVVVIELNKHNSFESTFVSRNFMYGVLCQEKSINIISEQKQLIHKYHYKNSETFYPYQQTNKAKVDEQPMNIRNANNFEIKELLCLLDQYSKKLPSKYKDLYHETMPLLEQALDSNKYDVYIKGQITLYDE